MTKLKALIKKITWFFIDLFAWFIVFCLVVLAFGTIKSSLFGTVVTLLFAFFISPLRRKILAKHGVKLKKKVVAIIGTVLCCMSMYQIGSADLGIGAETDVVGVSVSTENQVQSVIKEQEIVESKETVETIEEAVESEEITYHYNLFLKGFFGLVKNTIREKNAF